MVKKPLLPELPGGTSLEWWGGLITDARVPADDQTRRESGAAVEALRREGFTTPHGEKATASILAASIQTFRERHGTLQLVVDNATGKQPLPITIPIAPGSEQYHGETLEQVLNCPVLQTTTGGNIINKGTAAARWIEAGIVAGNHRFATSRINDSPAVPYSPLFNSREIEFELASHIASRVSILFQYIRHESHPATANIATPREPAFMDFVRSRAQLLLDTETLPTMLISDGPIASAFSFGNGQSLLTLNISHNPSSQHRRDCWEEAKKMKAGTGVVLISLNGEEMTAALGYDIPPDSDNGIFDPVFIGNDIGKIDYNAVRRVDTALQKLTTLIPVQPMREGIPAFPVSVNIGKDGGYLLMHDSRGKRWVIYMSVPSESWVQHAFGSEALHVGDSKGNGDAAAWGQTAGNCYNTLEGIRPHLTHSVSAPGLDQMGLIFVAASCRYNGEASFRNPVHSDIRNVPPENMREHIRQILLESVRAWEDSETHGELRVGTMKKFGSRFCIWPLAELPPAE